MTNQHPIDPDIVIDSFDNYYDATCGICELIETVDNPYNNARAPKGSIAASAKQIARNLKLMQECFDGMYKIMDTAKKPRVANKEVA